MAVKQMLRSVLRIVDGTASSASVALRRDRGLVAFMFHGLYKDKTEPLNDNLLPHQPFTVDDLDGLIRYFKTVGYRFVRPADIEAGLEVDGRYAMITFDDGYANNLRSLPVLQEHGVPATFFISSANIAEGTSYWWDAHYRARRRDGAGHDEILAELEAVKDLPYHAIEARLIDQFGADVFTPVDDTDRPMTEAELEDFASDPLVTIGNHTMNHAILTACSPEEAESQLRGCQDYLTKLLGNTPSILAYPNGNHSDRVIDTATAAGLRLAMTVAPKKGRPPFGAEAAMRIGRYCIDGGPDLVEQCLRCRSDIQLRYAYQRMREAG